MPRKKVPPTELKEAAKYYSLKPILSKNPDVAIVIGQRSNGKSFAACELALRKYAKDKTRFVYMRRRDTDINQYKTKTLFSNHTKVIEEIFGVGYYVYYWQRAFYICHDDEEGNPHKELFGYCVAISEAGDNKSVVYQNDENPITLIIFDEFIPMAKDRLIQDEMSMFENMLSTLVRLQDKVLLLMIANTVTKYSPYFVHYGVNIDLVEQGEIKTIEMPVDDEILRVVVEYCEYNKSIGKRTSKFITSKMIRTGAWEIKPTDEIPEAPNEQVTEKMLFSIYDPDIDVTMGVYFRRGLWTTLNYDNPIVEEKRHVREFFVIRRLENGKCSKYFHLTTVKSLRQSDYHTLALLLSDLEELTNFDFKRELELGRVYSDTMFTADTFTHAWNYYKQLTLRELL